MADKAPIKTFRDLIVWQRGMELVREIYIQTRTMPKAELFALTSQMRRAACSVPMNIAEGFGKHSRPEFVRGLRIAMGSLMELATAYQIATSLQMIKESARVLELLAEVDRLLNALMLKLEARNTSDRAQRRRNA